MLQYRVSFNFTKSKNMQTKKEFSDDIFIQKQSFILESIKQNRNRVLFFLAFVLYVLLTVLGTIDRDFFFESGISFPLLNIKLPLIAFYVVVPIIIILIHFNVLYLYQEHQKLLQKHSKIKKFYSSMPLGIFDMPIITKGTIHTLIKIFTYLVIYIMPLLTLYILWWHFNKYQSSFYSNLHLLYIAIDTLMLSYFLFSTKLGKILSALLWVSFILATLLQMAINNEERAQSIIYSNFPNLKKDTVKKFTKNYYPHLELSGEHLVSFNYNQLKTLQSLEKSKPLALLQAPLNLENRSFKYANFNHALLIGANLNGCNLQGASFLSANLQGATMNKTNLQRSFLWGANFQETSIMQTNFQGANLTHINFKGLNVAWTNLPGVDLTFANLQGANFDSVNLQGSILEYANLQGANLKNTNLIGADLSNAYLQGANLTNANLQGAFLADVNFQGADLSQTKLQGAYTSFKGKLLPVSVILINSGPQGSHIHKEIGSFEKRIIRQVSIKTNLEYTNKYAINKTEKEKLIKQLKKMYYRYYYIKDAIERIQKSTSAMPDLSKAKTGSYTKEEAQKWIGEYKKATGVKP